MIIQFNSFIPRAFLSKIAQQVWFSENTICVWYHVNAWMSLNDNNGNKTLVQIKKKTHALYCEKTLLIVQEVWFSEYMIRAWYHVNTWMNSNENNYICTD